MNNYQIFKQLHEQNTPLYIGNVWDVNSALMHQKAGYKALGTSSAAIAESLGYEDGENMPFDALLYLVKAITQKTSCPLTVDIEAGYSRDTQQIIEHIIQLNEVGAVGINLEDSIVTQGNRAIVHSSEFSETIKIIKHRLTEKGVNMFLNIRTDSFIMGLEKPLEASIARATLYEESGADGIFIPAITHEKDIEQCVKSVSILVNVMTMPNLPNFQTLQTLGVKRVSMGPFIYNKMNEHLNDTLEKINKHQSFDSLFKA